MSLDQRKPMRQRSAKKAKDDREFAKIRLVVIERDGGEEIIGDGYRNWYVCCQVNKEMGGHHCRGRIEVHHRRRRSQGGSNDPTNLIAVCSAGHGWIHANPAEAALFGLLIIRPDVQEDTP